MTVTLQEQRTAAHPLSICAPLGDRAVIKLDKQVRKTPGGIELPDTMAQSRQQLGVIISVGPGRRANNGKLIPMGLKVGTRVLITGYAGLDLRDPLQWREEDEYLILREEDVLATLPDAEEED